jgi:hypothetical protein
MGEILGLLVFFLILLLPFYIWVRAPKTFIKHAHRSIIKSSGAAFTIALVCYAGLLGFTGEGDITAIFLLYSVISILELIMIGVWVFMPSEKIGLRNQVLLTAVLILLVLPIPWFGWLGYQRSLGNASGAWRARAKSEIRNLAVAIELYYEDHTAYPPAVNEKGEAIPFATEGIPVSAGFVSWMLTTPEAYADSIHFDPFRDRKYKDWSKTYGYATDGKTAWILASRGPDRDFDLDLAAYITDASCDITRYLTQFGGTQVEYDPTNGGLSSGDVFRTGP